MHWIQIILETSREQCESLEDALLEQGALSVTYVDAGDQPLFEPDPGETPLWDAVRLVGLFPADAAMEAITEQLKTQFGVLTGCNQRLGVDVDTTHGVAT